MCVCTFVRTAQCENGAVRLSGGPNKFEGRVELCMNGNWGQVCGMGWTTDDAEVVCHQLGHDRANCEFKLANLFMVICADINEIAVAGGGDVYGVANLSAVVTDVRCDGTEDQLDHCPLATLSTFGTCAQSYAGVICQGQ